MATFTRPTLTQILSSIQADINERLPGADSVLTASVLNVIANVLAGVAYGEYGFIDWISEQVFPDTAVSENLRRWGAIWGVTPIPAIAATGKVNCTGTNGVEIPVGTEFQRADLALFISTEAVTISGGTASVPVEAQVAGIDGNTAMGAVMTFVSPINFVTSTGAVYSNGLVDGADAEADAPYLLRVLNRIQNPPQGGAARDYVTWALGFAGVTRAWVTAGDGDGTVGLQFMMDNTYDDGIPQSGDVDELQDYLDELRPVTADLTVSAPTADILNFNIHLNIADNSAIRADIAANLAAMLLADGEPGGTIYLSRINEAISQAVGEFDHVLVSPVANVTHSAGHIPVMGTITWS